MPKAADCAIHGVDFTSRPRRAKPITIASGRVRKSGFQLDAIDEMSEWTDFESWLRHPGPWIAGFDFPFGLPREAVVDLGWPTLWPELVNHCRDLGREAFRAALDGHREGRQAGNRYAHRAADRPAGSHSPLKLVNPPVGLMYLEGAPRLLDASVTIPGLQVGDSERIALEAYPGYSARQIVKASYKSDAPAKQTPARRGARKTIVNALVTITNPFGFSLTASTQLLNSMVLDATGDRLDSVI